MLLGVRGTLISESTYKWLTDFDRETIQRMGSLAISCLFSLRAHKIPTEVTVDVGKMR